MVVPVVFSSDHAYIMPTGVAILSMLEKSSDVECDIFILASSNVTDEDKDILVDIATPYRATLTFIQMEDSFSGAYEVRGITEACYYRLLIPWLIPQYDKILYCDGDIVFVDSISRLYAVDVDSYYVSGKKPYRYNKKSFSDYAPKLGIEPGEYINSGVLVINSENMRRNSLRASFELEAKKNYKFQDQDILNIVCKGKIGTLSPEFNVTEITPPNPSCSISPVRNLGDITPIIGMIGGEYIVVRHSMMPN